MDPALEASTQQIARQLAGSGKRAKSRVFAMSWWNERLMEWALQRPEFKTQLFRFVDVFPSLVDDDDVARHVDEYFEGEEVPQLLQLGGRAGRRVPGASSLVSRTAHRNISRMAEQFIIGSDAESAYEQLSALWDAGSGFTVDVLGEKTLLDAEADTYAAKVSELVRGLTERSATWKSNPRLEYDDLGRLPRVNVSVKPTALATHFEPLSADRGIESAKLRLRPILEIAAEAGAFVHVDMEHAGVKDLTLQLFRELLEEPAFTDLHAGIVIQAYLRDSHRDLSELIAWSSRRPVPVTVRLVKGAYWDAETIESEAAGWPSPVFEIKDETDANFERCSRLLLDNHGSVRAAIGSHNLRSIAHAAAYARHSGIPDDAYEIQMLHGMAEPLHASVRRMGLRHRVYCPVGELVPGMAYLVRRLLENTSNESFVRHRYAEGVELDRLLRAPRVQDVPGPTTPVARRRSSARGVRPYEPEPIREWRRAPVRSDFGAAVDRVAGQLGGETAALIGDEEVMTSSTIISVDPGAFDTIVSTSASCTPEHVDAAIETAVRARSDWAARSWAERADLAFAVADSFRRRRDELAALQVFEAGKPWDQADADVCEAIDFCEYYGRRALHLSDGGEVQNPPGERNVMRYQARGIAAVIGPWNFPLAIPTGMTMAALVTGNPVVLKPAEQTPAIARSLVDAVVEAGAPPGVIGFLPGPGETVGAALVAHPEVAIINFTGSREVGLAINVAASHVKPGQRHVKRVLAEMGGKNAVIVDTDADLDVAVPGVVYSAFGLSGQKCSAGSRVVVLDAVHDQFLERLAGASDELVIGHPRDSDVQVGPLIDADAQERLEAAVEAASSTGRVVTRRREVPATGWYVGATVVADVDPRSPVVTDELFGPLLAVQRARDLDDALELANDTPYALTGGVFSRSPSTIERVSRELRAGNIYINRPTTGAVVGRQPFGGHGLSGVGAKAGGPDHLHQFVDPVVVTENTVRQGFAG